jgi:hypothetical protein
MGKRDATAGSGIAIGDEDGNYSGGVGGASLLRAKRQIWQSYQTLWRNIGRSVG